jgi:hypothetical protein
MSTIIHVAGLDEVEERLNNLAMSTTGMAIAASDTAVTLESLTEIMGEFMLDRIAEGHIYGLWLDDEP